MNYGFNDDKEKIEMLTKAEALPKSDIVVITTTSKSTTSGNYSTWVYEPTDLSALGITNINNYMVLSVSQEETSSGTIADNTVDYNSSLKRNTTNVCYPMAYVNKSTGDLYVAALNTLETTRTLKCKVVLLKVA